MLGSYRAPLLLLQGSVLLVLLIATLNFANLIFAKTWIRKDEVATKAALGASRMRLLAESVSESLLPALLGAALGIVLAQAGIPALLALVPVELPRTAGIAIDSGTILFSLALAAVIGIGIGLAPALAITSFARSGLVNAGRGFSRPMPLRSTLVALQVAFSLSLLLSAALLLKSFHHVKNIDPGFDPGGLMTLRISLPPDRYPDVESVSGFFQRVSDRWKGIPGVRDVAAANVLPLSKLNARTEFVIADRPPASPQDKPAAQNRWVSPGYFRTMKIPLLRGRMFEESDRWGKQHVVIVDEALSTEFWPGADPIGKHLRIDLSPAVPEIDSEIVGVVRTVKHFTLEEEPTATL
jgi:putative ABC transport system permease protein